MAEYASLGDTANSRFGFGLRAGWLQNAEKWLVHVSKLKTAFVAAVTELGAEANGQNTSPYVVNFSVPGINFEAAMVKLKGIIAVSNGSACTSSSYTPSHVLTAIGLDANRIAGAIRVSFGVTCVFCSKVNTDSGFK